MPTPEPVSLEAAIERHLRAHPQAADSAEGVARWWLDNAGSLASLGEVERALHRLVRRRLVRRVTLADGTQLYCGQGAPRGGGSAPARWT